MEPITYYPTALPPGHPMPGSNGRASIGALGAMPMDNINTGVTPVYSGLSMPPSDPSYTSHYRPVSATSVPQQYQQQPIHLQQHHQQSQQQQQQYMSLQGIITPLSQSQPQPVQQHILPQHQQQPIQSLQPITTTQHSHAYKQQPSYVQSTQQQQVQHLQQLQIHQQQQQQQQQQIHHMQAHQAQQAQPQLVQQRQQIIGSSVVTSHPTHQAQTSMQPHVHQQLHSHHQAKPQTQQQQQQQHYQQQQQQQQKSQNQKQHYDHPRDHRNPAAMDHVINPQTSVLQLAEFASVMVYTLWHTRPNINGASSNAYNVVPHRISVPPSAGPAFRKFCLKVLSATQLSSSVILLSLKYIQKLLKNNPSIHGQQGSEFRLFTVSLMLANKFLDDNTFTNKTWSEVTGISVQEINVMEMEFLNQVQFSLFVSEAEYLDWLHSLETWLKQQGQGQTQGTHGSN